MNRKLKWFDQWKIKYTDQETQYEYPLQQLQQLDQEVVTEITNSFVCYQIFNINAILHTHPLQKQIDIQLNMFTYNTLTNGYCLQAKSDNAEHIFPLLVNSKTMTNINL